MNHFRQMVLLPIEEYKVYKKSFTMNSADENVKKLDDELVDIHSKYGTTLPADQRVKLEGDIIAKYSHKFPIQESNVHVESNSTQLNGLETAIDLFPKTHRHRSKQLYMHMKQFFKNVPWNEKGELLDVSNSNILDLITYVTAQRSGLQEPKGFSEFYNLLSESNTPFYMLSQKGKQILSKYNPVIRKEEDWIQITS